MIARSLLSTLGFAITLTACAYSFNPGQAAVQGLLKNPAVPEESIQVRQMIERDGHTYVLVSFESHASEDVSDCLFLYEVSQTPTRLWRTSSGRGGCGTKSKPILDLTMHVSDEPDGTHEYMIYGLVGPEEIIAVQAVWDNGDTSTVDVIDGSYLIWYRTPGDLARLDGLDDEGEVVYGHDYDNP